MRPSQKGGTNPISTRSTRSTSTGPFNSASSSSLNTTYAGNPVQSRINMGGRVPVPVTTPSIAKQSQVQVPTQSSVTTRQRLVKGVPNDTNNTNIKGITPTKPHRRSYNKTRKTLNGKLQQENLESMIETDFEGLLQQTLNDVQGKKPPAGAPIFNSTELIPQYSKLPTKVGPDPSGSIRRQRELEIELYNNHYQIAQRALEKYKTAEGAIVQLKQDIHQFLYNQRTLEEQLQQHQRNYHDYTSKLKVLVEETKKHELNLVKIKGQSDQLQSDVHKIDQDIVIQRERYDIEMQRYENLQLLAEQNKNLNAQKNNQITSLQSESKILHLRLEDVNTQLSELRANNDVDALELKEKNIQENKFDLEYGLRKLQDQLDVADGSIHTKELQQQSLLKTIGPETQQMVLELQSAVSQLNQQVEHMTRLLATSQQKIENYEELLPQRNEELELKRFDLDQCAAEYNELCEIVKEKKDIIKSDEAMISNIEQQTTKMQSNRHNEELQLQEAHEAWLKAYKTEKEETEDTIATMRSRHNTHMAELIESSQQQIAELENKRDMLTDLLESKNKSYESLTSEFTITTAEITSLQHQVDRYVELHAMSGPQLEKRIMELLSSQAKRKQRIRQLQAQNAAYDDDNLLLRRAKLQRVRDTNTDLENQIVQLGGGGLLKKITKPTLTPTYDKIVIDEMQYIPNDDDNNNGFDYSEVSSHLRDTIYEENGEEISATCDDDGDDVDNCVNGNISRNTGSNSHGRNDITETQSLLSTFRGGNGTNNQRSAANNNNNNNNNTKLGTATNTRATKITSRLSALPPLTTNTSTRTNGTVGTRPLGRAVHNNNSNAVGTRMPPGSAGINTNKVGPSGRVGMTGTSGNTNNTNNNNSSSNNNNNNNNSSNNNSSTSGNNNQIAPSAKYDNELPSYMRSTVASRRR